MGRRAEHFGAGGIYAPDYLNSLDAMHEAEKTLSEKQQKEFAVELSWLTVNGFSILGTDLSPGNKLCFQYAHATAAQRAEAFLRTIGRWT